MNKFLERLALYDIVGYLIPGMFVGLLVLALMGVAITDLKDALGMGLFLSLVGSYVLGFVVQSLARILNSRRPVLEAISAVVDRKEAEAVMGFRKRVRHYRLGSPSINKDLFRRVRDVYPGPTGMDDGSYLRYIDSLEIPTPMRDTYVARQGFHRGMAIVALMWAAAFAIASLLPAAELVGAGWVDLLFAFGCVVLALLFWRRYAQFVLYEIRSDLSWICVQRELESSAKEEGPSVPSETRARAIDRRGAVLRSDIAATTVSIE